jgi:uncharacterized protein (DUF1697 family)
MGFHSVAAYQAAGNITFLAADPGAVTVESIEAALVEAYGFQAPTFLRTIDELQAVIDGSPFTVHQLEPTAGRIQVTFMRAAPGEQVVAEVAALVPDDDLVVFADREWFWLPTRGVSDSLLPVAAIERLVGPMTMRTMGTISRMVAKFA